MRRRWWLASVALIAGVAGIYRAGLVGANEQALPEESASRLQCQATDLIFEGDAFIADFPDHELSRIGVELPASPREAVRTHVQRAYPLLDASRFVETARTSNQVEFQAREDGRLVAVALVINADRGWVVQHLTACNSFLIKYVDPSAVGGRR